jgi:DNA mismatch repair protein MutS2
LISRARKLVDKDHFSLDKLLNRTEQNLQQVSAERKNLERLPKENEKLKKELEQVLNREKHYQQIELLKNKNKISEEKYLYLKDMERKLKSVIAEWKKTDDKKAVIKMMHPCFISKEKNKWPKSNKIKLI